MDLGAILFGFSGRINRAKWWLGIFLVVVVDLAVQGLHREATAALLRPVLELLRLIFSTWVIAATGVKRLHDLGRTGHWIWLLWVTPILTMRLRTPQIRLLTRPTASSDQDGNLCQVR
jgi:uncharacterized membrane protein YhaH (DUF805 family)